MLPKDFMDLVQKQSDGVRAMSDRKSKDYAKEEDHLLNFKQMNQACKLLDIDVRRGPSEVARFFRMVKMQRIANLRGRDPANESVMDSEQDDLTYHFLYLACKEDERRENENRV